MLPSLVSLARGDHCPEFGIYRSIYFNVKVSIKRVWFLASCRWYPATCFWLVTRFQSIHGDLWHSGSFIENLGFHSIVCHSFFLLSPFDVHLVCLYSFMWCQCHSELLLLSSCVQSMFVPSQGWVSKRTDRVRVCEPSQLHQKLPSGSSEFLHPVKHESSCSSSSSCHLRMSGFKFL